MNPFPTLTLITPTYNRPHQLMACLASVANQTRAKDVQHLVLPDYVGHGIGAMYQEVEMITGSVRGEYVMILGDDDVLASPDVVDRLDTLVHETSFPEVLIVGTNKGGLYLPLHEGEPKEGQIDLGCIITRQDVWKNHTLMGHYGKRYEGDYDFIRALWDGGTRFHFESRFLFSVGGVSRGAPGHTCTPESHESALVQGGLAVTRVYTCPKCFTEVKRTHPLASIV